ncbi:MAG: hypothetical protein QGG36_09605 [Pirellulaceae bacterium]|jgi:PRTRC genetic system protein A|nr:hypothetical protein [Pirellulaceae bacterium]
MTDSQPNAKLSQSLLTPIYAKLDEQTPLPDDETAYFVLARNGLYLCRNHEFFSSCVRARTWPSELANHHSSLELRQPKIPREMIEQVVGFFSAIADKYQSEAGVLLAWDRTEEQLQLVAPRQLATVSVSYNGSAFPTGLHYETPEDLPDDWRIVGDIHSHVFESAYSSGQDKDDEEHRPGLHLVVGRLNQEPPEFHVEYVVDGFRFEMEIDDVIADYRQRDENTPDEWIEQVRVKAFQWQGGKSVVTYSGGWGGDSEDDADDLEHSSWRRV